MSAVIPQSVAESPFHAPLVAAGLTRIHQGKVRDTYRLEEYKLLLVIAMDRLSIFDLVLPCLIPFKGEILTGLTVFWLDEIFKGRVTNHLVAYGTKIDQHLPPALRGDHNLQGRAIVVEELEVIPVECIVRGYLTGSGWKSYQNDGTVCGQHLPPGLYDGARLEQPFFTPTTKAERGHDVDLNADAVAKQYGWIRDVSIKCYETGRDFALGKGFILADTKFEFGRLTGERVEKHALADEVLTPDSSRFWDVQQWEEATKQKKTPPAFDKEFARQWGKRIQTSFFPDPGLQKLDPENVDHLAFVSNLQIPEDVIRTTSGLYWKAFERLVGMELPEFQKKKLGVTWPS